MFRATETVAVPALTLAVAVGLTSTGCWGEPFTVAADGASGVTGSENLQGPSGSTGSVGGAQGSVSSTGVGGSSSSGTIGSGSTAAGGAASGGPTTGSVFGPGCQEVSVDVLKDTFVWGMFPDSAHDFMALGDDRLEVSQYGTSSKRTLLYFDFSTGPGWQLVAAYLQLSVVAADSYSTLALHRLLPRDWEERSATWLAFTTGQNWDAPGGDFEPEPFASADVNPALVGGKAVWDVTTQAQAIHAGLENYGWLLKDAGEPELGGGLNFAFAGREAEAPPTLVLHFCPTS